MSDLALGANAVHLCIDMQRLFADGGPWPMPWMARVLPNAARLVERAPQHTIFTRFITPVRGDDMPGRWRAYYAKWPNATRGRLNSALLELMPALGRHAPPAAVFDKCVYSAFANVELHSFLRRRAVDHGYRIVIARDGVCSSSDESHDATLDLYKRRFEAQIEVAEVDRILDAWRPG